MSYIDELRQSREIAQVAYQEFVLHTKSVKDGLFLFFEGKDIGYYLPRITAFYKGNYHPIKCKGKEKVIAVYDLIKLHTEYEIYKKAFFIDRDFNTPIIKDKDIFETPCYSIENLYVSVDVFKQIIKGEFGISEINNVFNVLTKLYEERQKEFHNAILLFNAWYACLIQIREQTELKTNVNLEEKLPKGFIKYSLESIECHYDIEKIKNVFKDAVNLTDEQLAVKINEFKSCTQRLVFRGKYEMEFLLKIIKLIFEDSISNQNIVNEKIKFSFSTGISNEQAISIFSAYAETPDSLNEYIKKITS